MVYPSAIMTQHKAFVHAVSAVAALVLLAGGQPVAAQAQQRAAAPPGLETIKVRDNVYAIFGAGANITVHVGEDGLILVDSGSTAMAQQVVAAVKAISTQPIRLIVNTSADLDHVGGNDVVGAAGLEINPDSFAEDPHATVLAHENVLTRLSSDDKVPTEIWPSETFTSRVRSMYLNNDAVMTYRMTGAHTDGDTVVLFRKADVIATGDIIDLRSFPVIDPAKGGSLQGELDALNRLLEMTVPAMPLVLKPGRTLLIPGHGRVSDYAELVEYRDMVTTIKDNIDALIKKGMTLEQVKAANPTAGYRARWGKESGPWTTDMFVEAVYNGLKNPPGKSS
jgi:glyoxylase-like metal-dependent hydrolase (beta-lactamase superfamily II)